MEMDFICWKALSLSLPLSTFLYLLYLSLRLFSFHPPPYVSLCDLSPDWVSEAFSFSSTCSPSSSKPSVFIRPHQGQHDLLWYFPNANLSLLTHMYKITVCVVCIFSSVLLYLSVGFSQRWPRGLTGGLFFKCHTILFSFTAQWQVGSDCTLMLFDVFH